MFTYRGYDISVSEGKTFKEGTFKVTGHGGLVFRVYCSLGVAYGRTPHQAETLIRRLIDESVENS